MTSGLLDPDRLEIVADALEEAGVGDVVCPRCLGKKYTRKKEFAGFRGATYTEPCPDCRGTGRVPHPLLRHLRGAEPFVRGDWAIDLLTGRT